MSNPADQHIVELIETLCDKADRCFEHEVDLRTSYVTQIAQLRASMNPVIHHHHPVQS
jgi:hypothetical protein